MKMNVALLAGGSSSERGIALQSAAQVENAFCKDRYNVMTIDVNGRDWHYVDDAGVVWSFDRNDFSVTVAGVKTVFDYAFIMIHGTPGEDGKLQGYLDIMGVPYSSCGVNASVVTFDKMLCKRTVAGVEGINLAKDLFLGKEVLISEEEIAERLGLPIFVKPNASGSSYGVTKVKRHEEIMPAIERAFDESDAVLIEECIAGREFGCGVLVTKAKEFVLPVTEIVSKNEFFDFEAKYTAGFSDEITPAPISDALTRELQRLAKEVYLACGCRGLARVDFIVTEDGRPYFIEVNSIPGMSPGSIVPKQIAASGMMMGQIIDAIIEDTCKQ